MGRRALVAVAVVPLVAAWIAGCGLGHSDTNGGDGSGGGSGSSSGGSSGGASPCPSSIPGAGAACTVANMTCEYGADPDSACNTIASCSTAHQWSVRPPDQAPTCPTPAASASSACPATYAAVPVGNDCTAKGTACAYAEGRCACLTPTSGPPHVGGGAQWACDRPAAAGCPSPRPPLGSACTASAQLACDYGACSLPGGLTESCTGGVWTEQASACPL